MVDPDLRGPLSLSNYVRLDSVVFWTKTNAPLISADETDRLHIVQEFDTFTRLSNQYYRDVNRGWLIKLRNNMLSNQELVPGDQIFIPTLPSLLARGLI